MKKYLMSFAVGALGYGLAEVIARGYTHWSMAIAGGTVLVLFTLINRTPDIPLIIKAFLGMVIITSIEFAAGLLVNVAAGWNVWSYSDKPFNIMGQICPQFSALWFAVSIPAFWLSSFIERQIETKSAIRLR